RCGQGVVDVVEARNAELDATRFLRQREVERDALEAVELDRPRGDIERQTRVPARGAAKVSEVPDVSRGVLVRRSAADAPLRVGSVRELGRGVARLVEAEHEGVTRPGSVFSGDVAELRVVRVRDEHCRLRQLASGSAPALCEELELPVAVELVAEEVPE